LLSNLKASGTTKSSNNDTLISPTKSFSSSAASTTSVNESNTELGRLRMQINEGTNLSNAIDINLKQQQPATSENETANDLETLNKIIKTTKVHA
jgi:hypothetical protein